MLSHQGPFGHYQSGTLAKGSSDAPQYSCGNASMTQVLDESALPFAEADVGNTSDGDKNSEDADERNVFVGKKSAEDQCCRRRQRGKHAADPGAQYGIHPECKIITEGKPDNSRQSQ